MKQYTVAVLGATGAVGREMIKILEERNFPIGELIPLASARSAGSTLTFRGKDVVVREVNPNAFEGVDIVLGAAPNKLAQEYAPHIVAAGAVFCKGMNVRVVPIAGDVDLFFPQALDTHAAAGCAADMQKNVHRYSLTDFQIFSNHTIQV